MPQALALATPGQRGNIPAVLTGSQIRAARALLRWSAAELSERCGVSYAAIQRAERADGMPNMQTKNLAAIKAALEEGGIILLADGDTRDGGPGVRLKS